MNSFSLQIKADTLAKSRDPEEMVLQKPAQREVLLLPGTILCFGNMISETICMKFQNLFSGKNKQNIINLTSGLAPESGNG